jgi:hypothetical protein
MYTVTVNLVNLTPEIKTFDARETAFSYWRYMLVMMEMFPAQIESASIELV